MAARAMATMMVSDKEGNDDGGKSNGDGNEDGVQVKATRANATATRAMVIMVTGAACNKEARVRVMPKAIRMMRVVGDEEGRGSMATATATRVVGEQLQWQQGWQARKRARSARAMAMAMKRQQRDNNETT